MPRRLLPLDAHVELVNIAGAEHLHHRETGELRCVRPGASVETNAAGSTFLSWKNPVASTWVHELLTLLLIDPGSGTTSVLDQRGKDTVEALGQFKAHRSAGTWNVRLVGSGGVAELDV